MCLYASCVFPYCGAGMSDLLSASSSLLHVNIDGCPRLSLAACPRQFVAVDSLVGGSQLTDGSSMHKRPGLLIRVLQ
jgi:hypothetical protein